MGVMIEHIVLLKLLRVMCKVVVYSIVTDLNIRIGNHIF